MKSRQKDYKQTINLYFNLQQLMKSRHLLYIQQKKQQKLVKRKQKQFQHNLFILRIVLIILAIMAEAYRRNPMRCQQLEDVKQGSASSLSTEGSSSPRYYEARAQKPTKEKLELCKKFTEFGYCPYEKKCKFAHGYHELRKNNSTNSKYKTKECVTFFKNCHCHYGSRCNFMHNFIDGEKPQLDRSDLRAYLQIFQCAKTQSKVLILMRN